MIQPQPSFSCQTPSWLRHVIGACLLVGALSGRSSEPISDSVDPERGLIYQNDRVESGPWSVHLVKVPWTDRAFEIRSTLANKTVLGLERLSDQVLAIPVEDGTPLAAVNGDFHERDDSPYSGDPRGLQILDGELVSAPANPSGHCAFWIDADGTPRTGDVTSLFRVILPTGGSIPLGLNEARRANAAVLYTSRLGRTTKTSGGCEIVLEASGEGPWLPLKIGVTYKARVREVRQTGNTMLANDLLVISVDSQLAAKVSHLSPGDLLSISTATKPDLQGVSTAIGGGSIITRSGKAAKIGRPRTDGAINPYSVSSMFERHPRSAVGWSRSHVYLVEVDGRQRGLSVGMTLEELGRHMAKLGCEEAINLDGGGSATFWYRGQVVNSPCDGTERPVANGLVVLRKTAGSENVRSK